jgi:WD40 repeat protein
MLTSSSNTIVLYKSKKERKQKSLQIVLVSFTLLFATYLALVDILPKTQAQPVYVYFLILMPIVFLLLVSVYQALKRERLILDADGIRYQSHLPKFLQGVLPMIYRDWSAKWAEITAAYLKPSPLQPGSHFLLLGLHLGLGYKELFACQWYHHEDDYPLKLFCDQQTPEQIKSALQRCPLIKYITDKGISIDVDPKVSLKTPFFQFAIESNQHRLSAAIFFLLLLGYAILDLMIFNQEAYVELPLYKVYLLGGVGMAAFVMGWLRRAKVSRRESIIIALFLGGVFGLALYPGLLRLNQLTDSNGLKSYQYELQSDLSFKPVNDNTLPTLHLNDDKYWADFEAGTLYEFELRKGGLGFYQISLAQVEKLKAELDKQSTQTPSPSSSYVLPNKLLHTLVGHRSNVLAVAFSPDGNKVASGSKDKTIKLWNVSTGKPLQTLSAHRDKVQSVAFSPDGAILASGSEDNTIKLWDIETGKLIRTLKGDDDRLSSLSIDKKMFSVAFSPYGHMLASGNWDKSITLWDVDTGKVLHFIKGRTKRFWGLIDDHGQGHEDSVNSVAFSPDGNTLASGGFDNAIKLWDVNSGKLLTSVKGHSNFVLSVTFSPDGNMLASSSYDKSIKLWEVSSGRVLQTLIGHKDVVTSVAFRSDGQIIASASFDKTIKLWEVSSGKLLSTLRGHSDYVNTVVFSPDGKILASASGDDTVKLWQ